MHGSNLHSTPQPANRDVRFVATIRILGTHLHALKDDSRLNAIWFACHIGMPYRGVERDCATTSITHDPNQELEDVYVESPCRTSGQA